MYVCMVVRLKSKSCRGSLIVDISDDDGESVRNYHVSLVDNKIEETNTRKSRDITPLELMVGAIEISYRCKKWIVTLDGEYMEFVKEA